MEFVAAKVNLRAYASFMRFAVSYYLNCNTLRGPTQFTGASSSCGGCQGAHGSLTANLCTDKTERSVEKVLHDQHASPMTARYLKNVFKLQSPERIKMERGDVDPDYFKRVPRNQWHETFRGTAFEALLNTTVEQSIQSNRVDCSLEPELRDLEDDLALKCQEKSKTPEGAVVELFERYHKMLGERMENIATREAQLDQMKAAYDCLSVALDEINGKTEEELETEPLLYEQFIQAARGFLSCRAALCAPLAGASSFFKTFMTQVRPDHKVLALLVRNYDLNSDRPKLKPISFYFSAKNKLKPCAKELDLKEVCLKLKIRKEEMISQKAEVGRLMSLEDIEALKIGYLGVLEERGHRRAPTESELISQLVDMTKRSDNGNKENISPEALESKENDPSETSTNQVTKKAKKQLSFNEARSANS